MKVVECDRKPCVRLDKLLNQASEIRKSRTTLSTLIEAALIMHYLLMVKGRVNAIVTLVGYQGVKQKDYR
jgi:hypothetical protein